MARKPNRRQQTEDEPRRGEVDGEETLEYTELVLLIHANNLPEAELLKAALQAHGIPAVLEGEGAGVAGIPDVGAGVPVLVPEELADEAAELIAELESAKPAIRPLGEGNDLEGEEIPDQREGDLEDIDEEDIDELDSLDDDDDWDDDEEDEDDDEDDDDEDEDEDDWDDDDDDL